jgi:transglutaminase-like putative cysteine protease
LPATIIYSDQQVRMSAEGTDYYAAYRVKLQRPEALAAGNIAITWNPDAGQATVHRLLIHRGAQTIDILKTEKFRILQRETALEFAVLDGQLTASLQVPGLQIGDELEFAATIRRKDPTLGDHAFGFATLPVTSVPGAFRVRLVWPGDSKLVVKTSADLGTPTIADEGEQKQIVYMLRDPKSAVPTEGAPARFNVRRLMEYSDFATWNDVAQTVRALFDRASQLSPASSLRAEAAKIAASAKGQKARAEAALAFAQEQIRYVYVGFNGGNYRPATADETWLRRFGDCKAKTALLLALLRQLGINAEAVLVNVSSGDGLDQRLPTPAMFDHVLVRARIDGQSYWLDGTRLGEGRLDTVSQPPFRWALPLTARVASLEAVPADPPRVPALVRVLDIDAREGVDKPARVKAQDILRGPSAIEFGMQLQALSTDDSRRIVESYWREVADWIVPDKASWRRTEPQDTLILEVAGEGKLDWEGSESEGRQLDIFNAGFNPPSQLRRPRDQDQQAPWLTDYPAFRCFVTTIRLPPPDEDKMWRYSAKPVNVMLGGTAYWRTATLGNDTIRTIMSRRVLKPEISAAEAADVNAGIKSFDNKISRLFEASQGTGLVDENLKPVQAKDPSTEAIDWTSPTAPCTAPPM